MITMETYNRKQTTSAFPVHLSGPSRVPGRHQSKKINPTGGLRPIQWKYNTKVLNNTGLWNDSKTGLLLFALLALCPIPRISGQENGKFENPTANTNNPDRLAPQVQGLGFLMKFGYLPQSDVESGYMRSQEELEAAYRRLQKLGQIPETGQLDDATMALMQKKRCGVRDFDLFETSNNIEGTDEEDYRIKKRKKRSVDTQGFQHHQHRHRHSGHSHRNRATSHINDPQMFAFGPSKWEKTAITFRILNYTPDLDATSVRDAIIRAFYVWSDVTLLTFHEIFHGPSDIEIKFARGYHSDGYPFDGPGMILAHAFFPGEERGGDVHFDDDEFWTQYSHEGTDLFAVAAHEIGHALGLAHSNVPGSLMYPWYQGFSKDGIILHSDDIVAVQYLYGAKYNPGPGPVSTIPPPRPDPGTRPPPSTRPPLTTRPNPTTTTTISTTTPTWNRPSSSTTQVIYTTKTVPDYEDPEGPPDPCVTKIDAIALIREEVYVFKKKWFWRRDEKGMMDGYPVEINRFWYGFPTDITHIDAVYERPGDGKIVFFIGPRYWIFNGNYLVERFPKEGRPLTDLGLPEDIKQVDAAYVWSHNKKTYFITGDMYWRYNEFDGRMDNDYPRDMALWGGVPTPVDGAFKFWDGRTYFFKGNGYWVFNDARMHVRSPIPEPVGHMWLGCTKNFPPSQKPPSVDAVTGNRAAAIRHIPNIHIWLLPLASICLIQTYLSPPS